MAGPTGAGQGSLNIKEQEFGEHQAELVGDQGHGHLAEQLRSLQGG